MSLSFQLARTRRDKGGRKLGEDRGEGGERGAGASVRERVKPALLERAPGARCCAWPGSALSLCERVILLGDFGL